MEKSILDPLLKITQALREGEVSGKKASIYIAEHIDNLLHDVSVNMEEPQKATANEYSGTISVSPEQSGIRLYEYQKRAVQNLDEWKRTGDSGTGLLILPAGGGKTLTATYWLMKSILDSGSKVLWIAHRHEILNEVFHVFERVCYQDLSPHTHKQEYRYRIISGPHDEAVYIRPKNGILIASKSSLTHDLSHIRQNGLGTTKTIFVWLTGFEREVLICC